MSKKGSVEFVFRMIDRLSPDYSKLVAKTKAHNKDLKRSYEDLRRGISGVQMAAVAIGGYLTGRVARSFITAGVEVQNLTTEFKVLLGSVEAAKGRMEELEQFAKTTPFQLSEVAQASKILETFTQGAYSTGDALRVVGDAASVTATKDFTAVATHVGRAYDALQNNRPVGEAMKSLQDMALVTGEARGQIEKLQAAGRGKEAWTVLEQSLKRAEGGMEDLSKTVSGLWSTFKDNMASAQRQILAGGAWDSLSEALQGAIGVMQRAIDNGLFQEWGTGLGILIDKIALLKPGLVAVTGALQDMANALGGVKDIGDAGVLVDAATTRSLRDQLVALKDTRAAYENILKLSVWERLKGNVGAYEKRVIEQEQKIRALAGESYNLDAAHLDAKIGGLDLWLAKQKAVVKEAAAVEKKAFIAPAAEDAGAATRRQKEMDEAAARLDAAHAVQDELLRMSIEGHERDLHELSEWYAERAEILQAAGWDTVELNRSFTAQAAAINKKYRDEELKEEQELAKKQLEIERQKVDAKLALAGQMVGLAAALDEGNKGIFLATKALGAAEVVVNTHRAVMSHMATGPVGSAMVPWIYAQGAASLGTILATTLKGFQFGGATGARDTVPAMISPDEVVLTGQQQRRILALASGRGGGGGDISIIINAPGGDPAAVKGAVMDGLAQSRQERLLNFHKTDREVMARV